MLNTQKKHRKKVERKREVEKKLLRRRLKKRIEEKKVADEYKAKRDAERIVNRHTSTICYDKGGRLTEEDIRQRLDRNMDMLKALQDEYEAEQKVRAANQITIPELQNRMQAEPNGNWGGSAGVEFNPNPDPVPEALPVAPTDDKPAVEATPA
jgi:hypothetical protein